MTIINMSKFSPFFSAAASLGLAGSGSLTPPPASGLGLFGNRQPHFSTAPGADRNAAAMQSLMVSAYAAAAAARQNGATFGLGAGAAGANNNLFTTNTNKTRHNSIDRAGAATNRSALLEEFRYSKYLCCVISFALLIFFLRQITYTQSFLFPPLKDTKEELLCYSINLLLLFLLSQKKISLIHLFYNCSTTYYKFSLCVFG